MHWWPDSSDRYGHGMALIKYKVTETRTIEVAAMRADDALVLARQQEEASWTIRQLDVSYEGSAGWDRLPGNEAEAENNPWNDPPPVLDA